MNMQVLDAGRDASGGYKVDVKRGERVGRVSSRWFSRPDDERFLSLGELAAMVRAGPITAGRASWRRPASMSRRAAPMPSGWRWCSWADAPVEPNHWSFGQLAAQIGAPPPICASFPLRWPASICNMADLHRAEQIKTFEPPMAASNCAR